MATLPDALKFGLMIVALFGGSCLAGHLLGNFLCYLSERKIKDRIQRSYDDAQRAYDEFLRNLGKAPPEAERAK